MWMQCFLIILYPKIAWWSVYESIRCRSHPETGRECALDLYWHLYSTRAASFGNVAKITGRNKAHDFHFHKTVRRLYLQHTTQEKGILQLLFFVLLLVSLKRAIKYIKTYVQYAGFEHLKRYELLGLFCRFDRQPVLRTEGLKTSTEKAKKDVPKALTEPYPECNRAGWYSTPLWSLPYRGVSHIWFIWGFYTSP